MSFRALVAIESCHAHKDRHQVIRDTWMKDLCITEKMFFLGLPSADSSLKADEELLDVDDSYGTLSLKTQAICEWALDQNFDFMLKCDNDTIINPWSWFESDFKYYDYIGGFNEDVLPEFGGKIQFASGGAGYWLNKKCMTIVAESDIIATQAEDVAVAHALSKYGISPRWNPGYKWKPGSVADEETVTYHLTSAMQTRYNPELMREVYQRMKPACLR